MKRNFLLMLLLTLLPFVGWAAVEVSDGLTGGYTVTISEQYLALTDATVGVAAPTITKVVQPSTNPPSVWQGDDYLTDAGVYVKNGTDFQKVATPIKAVGTYYKGVYFTAGTTENPVKKVLYVPFFVTTPSLAFDYIHDADSWNASYQATAPALGGLKNYYAANADEDRWNSQEDRWAWASDKVGGEWPDYCEHSWRGAQAAPNALYPWIVPYLKDVEGAYVLVFKYPGYNDSMPWGTTTFGTTGTRVRGCASIPEELGVAAGMDPRDGSHIMTEEELSAYPFAQRPVWDKPESETIITGYTYPNYEFDINKFKMLLVPAEDFEALQTVTVIERTALTVDDVDVETTPLEYNGQTQYPTFSGTEDKINAWVFATIPNDDPTGDPQQVTLTEGVDYVPEYVGSDNYKNVGTKNFKIKLIGQWTGDIPATYNIVGKQVSINPANVEKFYGDDDPVKPDFAIDASSLVEGEDVENNIMPYLFLRRATGDENQGENVGEYHYYIDFVDKPANPCHYNIKILQEYSLLKIKKRPIVLHVTNNIKEFNTPDPATWEFTVLDAPTPVTDLNRGLPDGKTKDDVNPTITREGTETAVNAEGTTTSAIATGEAYEFKGESKNYSITFDNGLLIVPSSATNGIAVVIKNKRAAETSSLFDGNAFVYQGSKIEPTAAEVEVQDNGTVVDPRNYDITGYGDATHDNTHVKADPNVKEGLVKVTMKGNYQAVDVTGEFDITKAPLTITAKSYSLTAGAPDPNPFEVEYDGFLGNDWNETAPDKVIAKGFTAPSGVTKEAIGGSTGSTLKVIEDAKADDYIISYETGLLTFGETGLIVKADNKNKTYGAADPTFTVTVTKVGGGEPTETELAYLTDGGTPCYTLSREGAGTNEGENAGTYTINVKGPKNLGDGVVVTYNTGVLTIGPKTVFLRGDAVSKVYGDPNPAFDASVWELGEGTTEPTQWADTKKTAEGVTNGTFYYVGVQGANWNGNTWVLTSEDVTPADGGYTVQAHLFTNGITTSGNYRVVADYDHSGKFTITPAPLTIKADDKTQLYGAAEEPLTITATTLKRNDVLLAGTDYTIAREEGTTVKEGGYAITVATVAESVATGTLKNYNPITCNGGTYTITPVGLKIVANDQAINYAQDINPYDVTVYFKDKDGNVVTTQTMASEEVKKIMSLSTEVTAVGYHENAFTLNKSNDVAVNNYTFSTTDDFTNGWLTIRALKVIPLAGAALKELVGDIPLAKVLEDHKGKTVKVVLPKRAMEPDEWYEWVLPFNVTPRDFFSTHYTEPRPTRWGYGAIDVLDVAKSKNGQVVFDMFVKKEEIPANTPFLVKVDEKITSSDMATIEFEGVTIAADATYYDAVKKEAVKPVIESNDKSVKFVGLYEDIVGVADNQMFLAQVDPKPKREFYRGGESCAEVKLIRTKAYLEFPTPNAANDVKIYIQEPDGTYTAINGVEAENVANAEGIYNLSGQRVSKAQKGIYIKDGKKVLVK